LRLKKILLPNTLGPELLMPLLFTAFVVGHEFIPNTEIPWHIQGFLYAGLIAVFLKVTNHSSFLVLLPILAFHTLIGMGTAEKKAPTSHKNGHAYQILDIKASRSNLVQAVGQIHELKRGSLYPTRSKTLCLIDPKKHLQRGDFIYTLAPVSPIKNTGNPGSFDVKNYYMTKGIHLQSFVYQNYIIIGHATLWDSWIYALRTWFNRSFERHLCGPELGLAKALLLGNTTDVSQKSKASFAATGAIHVLAVSGMHVALFAELLLFSIGLFARFISRKWAILFILIILWCYAWLTGFSASVLRSVTMFSLIQIGLLLQRSAHPNYLLFWCAYLMYLFDPTCIYDIGFQLSFCAVFGIQTYNTRISSLWSPPQKILKWIWEHTSVAIAAQLFTVPLILYYFHTFPNYFLIANLGIVVLSGVSMYLGFGFLLLGWIPMLGDLIGQIFSLSLTLMNQFIRIIAQIPGAVEGGFSLTTGQLVLFIFGLLWILHSYAPWWTKYTLGLGLVLGLSGIRHNNQMETHLMILNARSPVLIYKQKTHVVMLSGPRNSQRTLGRLLTDYRKIYPFSTSHIQTVSEQSNVRIKGITFRFRREDIAIRGRTEYSLVKTPTQEWVLLTLNQKTKPLQAAIKLPI
jgi:ComEC/Rec2-related protein